uniref:DUF3278 domain-containing protein n=1 Tax=Acrobeloides nanus TaxID=290746 RepID=A0A914CCL7_9BILA
MAIERTIATCDLKSYENFKNPILFLIALIIQWTVGFGIYCYFKDNVNGYIWEFIAIGIMILSFSWIVLLHFFNRYRYQHRKVRVYSLQERFQLSENIRFLSMILWCSITALLGSVVTMIIYLLPYDPNDDLHHAFNNAIYQNSFVILAISVISVAILTNRSWRNKFLR